MKILLQSTLFHPSVGGIETVSLCLAKHYTSLGHQCTVLTRSSSSHIDEFSFAVARNPNKSQLLKLLKEHEIIHCNGASMELVFWAKLLGKPVVWTHQGYQMMCIDGLGWYEGEPSPLRPLESFRFQKNKVGFKRAFKEYSKLLLRRWAGKYLVDQHVAITKWVLNRQDMPNQKLIYNPFPIGRFAEILQKEPFEYDFFFLGRLVSEKGVGTLIKAFAHFVSQNPDNTKKLLIIGDGNWKKKLLSQANELGVLGRLDFVGKQTGDALLALVAKGNIAIIPSEWEEPMGGVALEMLAANKPVIVSQNGGLAECVGDAGITFANGDYLALAKQMQMLYADDELQNNLKKKAEMQLDKFQELDLTKQYIDLFEKLLKK
jgi:glycosyltransferase involved in cell wall biosynthesis